MTNKAEYDKQAADYDQSRFTNDMGRHLDYMHKRIVDNLLDPSEKRLLEAGVGTGRFAAWLAKRGFEVIGVDLSREMLKKAKEKKALLNIDVELVQADVSFLPFRPGFFDSCFCVNVLDHLGPESIGNFFKEAKYVVKPKGSLVFNFSNIQSPYLPIAALVNLRKRALFTREKVFSMWLTLKSIKKLLFMAGVNDIEAIKGCMIASPVPFAKSFIKIIPIINSAFENSKGKIFCGSVFVRASPSSHNDH